MAKITRFSNDGTQKSEELDSTLIPNIAFFEDAFNKMENEEINMVLIEFDEKCKLIFSLKEKSRFS